MNELRWLLEDPRPDLNDSERWTSLLRKVPQLPDKQRAYTMHTLLWSLRNAGALLQWTTNGTFIKPLLEPVGMFDTEEEFKDVKRRHLGPFEKEILWLLADL